MTTKENLPVDYGLINPYSREVFIFIMLFIRKAQVR